MGNHPLLASVVILIASAVPGAGHQAGLPPPAAVRTERVMRDLAPADVRSLMDSFNRALGVTCEHCHVQDRWEDESKPPFGVSRNMFRMVAALNAGALKDVGTIGCWTCHRGEVRPSRLPRPALDAELSRWPAALAAAPDSQKLAMAVYNVTLGVSCDFCHTGDWKSGEKKPMKIVPLMTSMFDVFPKYMPATARTQCWMCHKGSTKPEVSR